MVVRISSRASRVCGGVVKGPQPFLKAEESIVCILVKVLLHGHLESQVRLFPVFLVRDAFEGQIIGNRKYLQLFMAFHKVVAGSEMRVARQELGDSRFQQFPTDTLHRVTPLHSLSRSSKLQLVLFSRNRCHCEAAVDHALEPLPRSNTRWCSSP